MKQIIKEFFSPINIFIRFVKDMKVALTNDPLKCYRYTENELLGRFMLGEEVIAKSSECSLRYAKNIMKGRFQLGEEAIAKDAHTSYFYAVQVLKGRFELGEEAIARECEWSYSYALEVMKGRFELGEEAIAESSRNSFRYATDIMKGRFELGEEAILENVILSRDYLSFLLTIMDGVKPTGTIYPFGYPLVSSQDSVIPITQGGTGADNIVQAIANLSGISTDAQTSLDAKLNNSHTLTKTDWRLSDVDNISDINKSISTADPSGKDKMEIYRCHVK